MNRSSLVTTCHQRMFSFQRLMFLLMFHNSKKCKEAEKVIGLIYLSVAGAGNGVTWKPRVNASRAHGVGWDVTLVWICESSHKWTLEKGAWVTINWCKTMTKLPFQGEILGSYFSQRCKRHSPYCHRLWVCSNYSYWYNGQGTNWSILVAFRPDWQTWVFAFLCQCWKDT